MLQAILPILLPILGKFIPDPQAAAQAQIEMTRALMENQQALVQAMAEVMKADAASESWLTRNARPLVVLWGLFMVTFVGVVAPALGVQDEVVAGLSGIPSDLWTLVTAGVGIWFTGRTLEKALPALRAPK